MNPVLLVWLLLLSCSLSRAADPENDAFNTAAKAFQDGFYDRAEREFGEFSKKFPDSTRVSEAILLQGQSLYQLKRYVGAANVLRAALNSAKELKDRYLFWLGQSEYERGEYALAAEQFAQVLKDFPSSTLRLNASYAQALAKYKGGDRAGAIDLLRQAGSPFQTSAQAAPKDELAVRGSLLLGEALLAQREFAAARTVLEELPARNPAPDLEWERVYLSARLELADQQFEKALAKAQSAVSLASALKRPLLEVKSLTLQADILNLMKEPEKAILAYDRILAAPGMPSNERLQALLRIVDIHSGLGQFTNAVARLTKFLEPNPLDPDADLLHLTLGELQLKEFRRLSEKIPKTNLPAAAAGSITNWLTLARGQFDLIIGQFTNSAHLAKALSDRGWTFWEEAERVNPGRFLESLNSFQAAAGRFPRSLDQAEARIKCGDCLFEMKDYPGAITNYEAVIGTYGDLAPIRANLLDRVHYQLLRVFLETTNFSRAEKIVAKLVTDFPESALGERATLLYAEALNDSGRQADARAVLSGFPKTFPNSSLQADAELALVRTRARDGNFEGAVGDYDRWLTNHLVHPSRGEVEFDRAWSIWQAGHETNAFIAFTNFVGQFPLHPLAPKAQNWIADYYYGQENWPAAEQSYQQIYENTNWPPSELAYQARLMAARTAFLRQSYADAAGYLKTLLNDLLANDSKGPDWMVPDVYFLLGDVFSRQASGSTNSLQNFKDAALAFTRITQGKYATSRLQPLAWGRLGDCNLQLRNYEEARKAYRSILESKLPEVPISARNQAEVGLGNILEKEAEDHPPAEQITYLSEALDRYLNVVYGNGLGGQKSDPFWLRYAAQAAVRLVEGLNKKPEAIKLYERLITELPSMRDTWEKRIDNLRNGPGSK